jgi:hypothetical protein
MPYLWVNFANAGEANGGANSPSKKSKLFEWGSAIKMVNMDHLNASKYS